MNKTALVLLNDLMFQVKVSEAAKRSGWSARFVGSPELLTQALREQRPDLIILDLNCISTDPAATIRLLKNDDETRHIPLLGYVSHVQVDLRRAAAEAGCNTVLARSAFVQNLGGLFSEYAASTPAQD